MKYMGSKSRISKEILPIILKNKKENQHYVEPFVGGANLIDKVQGPRIASDINYYLIKMWQMVEKGWIPPTEFTEEEYQDMKRNPELYDPHLVGYVGFALSYGGKWFGGWRRDKLGKRNYVDEAYRNAKKQFGNIKGIQFHHTTYDKLVIPPNSLIYCDPPYENTTKYKDGFDHDKFWSWVREMTMIGHEVFVSEYEAPEDFYVLWEKKINSSLTKDTGSKKSIEKLFVYKLKNCF